MAAETGFLIDGQLYEMPTRDSFDLDEWQVMWDCARLTLLDFLEPDEHDVDEERDEKFRNPGLYRALMQIAYQREHPTTPPAKVKALIGRVNMLDVLAGLVGPAEEADAEIPPASTTEPEQSSSKSSVENDNSTPPLSESSTDASQNGSAAPDDQHATTGALRSVTSSITHGEISAA